MAPARKKSVNKRFLNEVSPEKEVRNSNKNKERVIGKRRLYNKLGPRWSDGELQRFYKAYRVHGADLKKIAAEVPNRSVEMVQALYRMNKVYLSLPEGTASVVGLIAMMTDHYSTLEVSDSDRESSDVLRVSRKPHKSKRTKPKPSMSKEDFLQSHSIASSDGYLSLLKKGHFHGGQPRAVGKRTPRIPVSRESYVSTKRVQRSENDANEEEVAHVAALALTEGLRRVGSPQDSHISRRRTEDIKSLPIRSLDIQASKIPQPKSSHNKLYDASIYGEWTEGGGRKGAYNGAWARDVSALRHMEGFGTVEVHQKGKKFYENKVKVEEIWNCHSDDGGEACSGTEEGPKVGAMTQKDIEESNAEIDETSLQAQNKRTDKNFSGDEFSALDALHALANISVMESESSVQLNEERTSLNMDDKSNIPEATSTSHQKDKIKLSRRKDKVHNAINEVEHASSRKSKLGRHMEVYAKSVSEVKPHPQSVLHSHSNNSALKRKRQCLASKVANGEASINSHHGKQLKAEVEDEEIISALKVKRTCQSFDVSKQLKAVGVSEGYCTGHEKGSASEVVKSTAEAPISSGFNLPMRKTSRRKMGLKRVLLFKEGSSSENVLKNLDNRYFVAGQETPLLKEKLSCSLSSPMVRRWCTFEWFYSAIDYPWFAKREFVEYLNHVGLGHMPTLTRVEWGVIRSSLGKPRRFSESFLCEEREKLKLYRDSVRKHYTELRTGIREGLPTDLAKPLTVGQRVIAVHPRTRELKDGSVLTVDHDCCRVQFDCPEMGVEFVMDIDCMPLNPVDNMPESLRRRRLPFMSNEVQVNGNSNIGGCTTSRQIENSQTPTNVLVKQVFTNNSQAQAASVDIINAQQIVHCQPSAAAQLLAKEVDIQAVPERNHASEKKNSSAFPNSRKQGTYHKIILPPWLKPSANCNSSGTLPSSRDSLVSKESESTVAEIVRGSKQRAQTMIDAAVQAISSMKEGEDAFVKIGEALDSIDQGRFTSESKLQVIRSPEQGSHNNPLISSSFESHVNNNANEPKSHENGDKIESAIPSELITSCVATLLMIQTCTERQYPPADVAQIIDSAVTSLHPCCSQNLPIYREIQMCMGRIKTQILALIPT